MAAIRRTPFAMVRVVGSLSSWRCISRTQRRTFIPGLAASSSPTRKVFSEQHTLGYSPQQVFHVAENINDYKLFLPWCLESRVLRREGPDRLYAKLVVGFGPLREEYTSCVTMSGHHYLKSVCSDGKLFSSLLAEWNFEDGPPHPYGPTCNLSIKVDFQFQSALHSALAHMFYNEVVRTMVSAFQKRCYTLYGPDFLNQTQRRRKRRQVDHQGAN